MTEPIAPAADEPRRGWLPDLPFAAAAFLASSLIFVVQPLIGRQLLPLLGGAPAVWTTCVLFFQVCLLIGYAWAHLGPRWLGDRAHAIVHIVLLAIGCVFLPLGVSSTWQPDPLADPVWTVLRVLALSIGVPICVLSATSPLIQRWHVALRPRQGDRVYRLYAIGNVASLLVLLIYPIAVEPTSTLTTQRVVWSWAFAALAALLAIGAVARTLARVESVAAEPDVAAPARVREVLAWIGLSAVPCSLFLGTTTYLTSDVAPVPFLWVLPLAAYLGAFSLAFAGFAPGGVYGAAIAPALAFAGLAMTGSYGLGMPMPVAIVLRVAAVLLLSWTCLAELYRRRPGGAGLTRYYLWIAVGGVVGGAFNSIVAPLAFNVAAEYPIALGAAAIIAVVALPASPRRFVSLAQATLAAMFVAAVVYAILPSRMRFDPEWSVLAGLLVVPAALVLGARRFPRTVVVLAGVAACGTIVAAFAGVRPDMEWRRSFFGVYRYGVPSVGARMAELTHGTTMHGQQHVDENGDPIDPDVPLSYYYRGGPVSDVMDALRPRRIAVVGLGIGSLAAYAEAGDAVTFYEIDPLVIDIAERSGQFSYLSAARERGVAVDIVEGDARLTLDREQRTFDVIVLDAFSGDAVPVHLLTREAFAVYGRRLAPDGVLAVHISNRYLDLSPIISASAPEVGPRTLIRADWGRESQANPSMGEAHSVWMAVSRRAELELNGWKDAPARPGIRGWTDQFSNLFEALR